MEEERGERLFDMLKRSERQEEEVELEVQVRWLVTAARRGREQWKARRRRREREEEEGGGGRDDWAEVKVKKAEKLAFLVANIDGGGLLADTRTGKEEEESLLEEELEGATAEEMEEQAEAEEGTLLGWQAGYKLADFFTRAAECKAGMLMLTEIGERDRRGFTAKQQTCEQACARSFFLPRRGRLQHRAGCSRSARPPQSIRTPESPNS